MDSACPPDCECSECTVHPELLSCAARPSAHQHAWDQVPDTDAVVCVDCGLMARLVLDPGVADEKRPSSAG